MFSNRAKYSLQFDHKRKIAILIDIAKPEEAVISLTNDLSNCLVETVADLCISNHNPHRYRFIYRDSDGMWCKITKTKRLNVLAIFTDNHNLQYAQISGKSWDCNSFPNKLEFLSCGSLEDAINALNGGNINLTTEEEANADLQIKNLLK